ncbi:MBL fold metallo-hydrolase [Thalassotalea sp. PS06]|nr:MBL fold metallo-hydrolase [Thalassotalea sp. PS06]
MKIHQINGYIQNIFLIEYDHGLFLLDGCAKADVETVAEFVTKKLKRPITDLKLVVVTHMHPDHAGGAHKFRRLFNCKIVSANVPGHWYQGWDGILMHWTDLALTQWVAKRRQQPRKSVYYPRKLKADILLDDGDRIPGFEAWQVLNTQGHTDRDLSLYNESVGKIYIADLLVRVKGKLVPPFPVFYPRRYRESIERLRAMKDVDVLMAHGPQTRICEDEFTTILKIAPKVPMTHWRSTKAKFKKAFFS